MKHLNYILDKYGVDENAKALKSAPKLTKEEIDFFKDLKQAYEWWPAFDNKWDLIFSQLSMQELTNLLKVNTELLELFI